MDFEGLLGRLLIRLRMMVRNGEITERGLAIRVGLSQPHIHNVLCGTRILTPKIADMILFSLRISLLDLVEAGEPDQAGTGRRPLVVSAEEAQRDGRLICKRGPRSG
jgi:hypothetical protein